MRYLIMVKQFIDELKGEIYVGSEPQKGSIFTCLIPLQEPLLDDASGIDVAEDLKIEKPYFTSLTHQPLTSNAISESSTRVLVVEDNFIAQTVAKRLLSTIDCQVDVASNGVDAISLCEQNHEEALKNCSTSYVLNELLTLMVKDLPFYLDQMKQAFKQQDYSLIEKIAHKIKGGAIYVGTTRMKYACQYVERYWRPGQRELIDTLCHQAIMTIEETITYLENWLKK